MEKVTYEDVIERVIFDLESWCDNYHPSMYIDPSKSIRVIAERAKHGLSKVDKSGGVSVPTSLNDRHPDLEDCEYLITPA